MRGRWLVVVAIAVLATPVSALAGGWATVGLSSTPDGLRSGDTWVVELELLQHGQTPLEGVEPAVTITQRGARVERSVPAEPAGRSGVYRAEIVFPHAGTWRYAVDDGFSQVHTYPPVRISGESGATGNDSAASTPVAGGAGGSGSLGLRLGAALGAGMIVAGAALAVRRRNRRAGRTGPVAT